MVWWITFQRSQMSSAFERWQGIMLFSKTIFLYTIAGPRGHVKMSLRCPSPDGRSDASQWAWAQLIPSWRPLKCQSPQGCKYCTHTIRFCAPGPEVPSSPDRGPSIHLCRLRPTTMDRDHWNVRFRNRPFYIGRTYSNRSVMDCTVPSIIWPKATSWNGPCLHFKEICCSSTKAFRTDNITECSRHAVQVRRASLSWFFNSFGTIFTLPNRIGVWWSKTCRQIIPLWLLALWWN